jgi:(2Fe-2S) ferredoxin
LTTSTYITESTCLGPCPEDGATVVVYPENVWYTQVSPQDVDEIIDSHMVGGVAVERLRDKHWPG